MFTQWFKANLIYSDMGTDHLLVKVRWVPKWQFLLPNLSGHWSGRRTKNVIMVNKLGFAPQNILQLFYHLSGRFVSVASMRSETSKPCFLRLQWHGTNWPKSTVDIYWLCWTLQSPRHPLSISPSFSPGVRRLNSNPGNHIRFVIEELIVEKRGNRQKDGKSRCKNHQLWEKSVW